MCATCGRTQKPLALLLSLPVRLEASGHKPSDGCMACASFDARTTSITTSKTREAARELAFPRSPQENGDTQRQ